MMRPSMAWIGWLCCALVATFPLAAGEERSTSGSSSGKTSEQSAAEPEVSPFVKAMGGRGSVKKDKVYSNTDLERMYGGRSTEEPSDPEADAGSDEKVPADASEAPAEGAEDKDALTAMLEGEEARKEHEQKVAEAAEQVTEARQRVADLEKRKLALQNPFLARPDAPEEGGEAWQQMDGDQRVHQTEIEMQTARKALAEAEAELARVRGSGS